MIAAIISAAATFLVAAVSAAVSYGILRSQVQEMRATMARGMARLGDCEGEIKAILARLDEQRELSGRVRG